MPDLSQFGTDGLIAGLLVIFAILGFLKTMVRVFFLLIALAIGGVAGIWGYNNGFSLAKILVENPESWMITAVAVITFVGGFFFARTILGMFAGGSKDEGAKTLGFGLSGAILSLLLGGVIAYGALTGVRYAGTMAELERLKDYTNGTLDPSTAEPLFAKLKNWIDTSRLGQFHQQFDFINDPAKTNLAKLAVLQESDEAVKKVGAEGILDSLPDGPELQALINEGDFSGVLERGKFRDFSREAKMREQLMELNIEKSLGMKK